LRDQAEVVRALVGIDGISDLKKEVMVECRAWSR
jgi:hypothetical protein